MTDLEFEVLDELYFVQSFTELQEETSLEAEVLRRVLEGMYHKGWLHFMADRSGGKQEAQHFPENYAAYYFLATKEGLLAHNSR